jgi:hypothetical protein
MRVLVAFEFKGVPADGEQADQIIDVVGEACETLRKEFNADACYVEDAEWD